MKLKRYLAGFAFTQLLALIFGLFWSLGLVLVGVIIVSVLLVLVAVRTDTHTVPVKANS